MLTLHYLPYTEICTLASNQRIEKLLSIVREEQIVVMEGRLTKEEEAQLIQHTMIEIDDTFKGIEIATIEPFVTGGIVDRFRQEMANMFLGNRSGLTVIGPATVVKKIKQDPKKIELYVGMERKKASKRLKGKKSSKS